MSKKPRFAQDLSTDEIRARIARLVEHKAITEIDLLLAELHHRKEQFKARILNEMVEK